MSKRNIEGSLFQLKFTSKLLRKQAKKLEKGEITEKNNLKNALQKGNMTGAEIYATNAIRKKAESLNLLKLSSRIDAIASRVESAVTMQQVSNNMLSVVKGMNAASKSMNLEMIVSVMDSFESEVETLDVRSSVIDEAVKTTDQASIDPDYVDAVRALIDRVKDENGIELENKLPAVAVTNQSVERRAEEDMIASKKILVADGGSQSSSSKDLDQDLAERLKSLRESRPK